jgi:isoquinoline 1-oxidoreductase beta subunit
MKIEQININRRTLFKAAGITASSGLLYSITACSEENTSISQINDIQLYLNINETHLRFLLPRAEMGQDLATSFAMIIAEEMHFPFHLIKVDFADADPLLGDQMTVGSASIRTWWQKLRDMGASFRACALHYAAKKFAVDPQDCYFEDGYLLERNNTFKLQYLALLRETPLTTNITLSPTKQKDFKLIGHSISSNSAKEKATGIFKYLGDYQLSDLDLLDDKFSHILNTVSIAYKNHWPKPNSIKLKEWQQQFKLDHILELKQNFSGFDYRLVLISKNTWPLFKCKQIITQDLKQALEGPEFIKSPSSEFDRLDKKTTIKRSQNQLECSFYTPEIAHAPMETQTVIALFHKEKSLEIWTPTQAPQHARKRVADKLGLTESNITLHTSAIGGSFGRKRYDDFIIEAALISQAMLEKGHSIPIKLLWTREDDLGREHYRPATFQSLSWSSKDKTNIQHRLVESHSPGFAAQSSEHHFYSHLDWEIKTLKSSLPGKHITGIWRSIHHGYLAFSICSFIDELSYFHAEDPIDYCRQHVASLGIRQQLKVSIDPRTRYQPKRLINTINTVETLSDWPSNALENSALGFASYYCFDSYISIVVKISLDKEQLKIEHIWASVDCGIAIHPDGLKAQIEGGLLFGLSACLYGQMPEDSKLLTANFDQYQVARMSDTPEIEVHIEKSTFDPSGAGELGVPGIAPAITNAYRKLTGKRFLRMPFLKNGRINNDSLAEF